MRTDGLFIVMLAVFEFSLIIQMTAGGPASPHINPMFGAVLMIGAIVAVPVIFLLFLCDAISRRWRFPVSAIILAALSVLSCAAVAFLIERSKDRPTPTTAREWLAALVEFSPVLTTACVPLARQIYRAAAGSLVR